MAIININTIFLLLATTHFVRCQSNATEGESCFEKQLNVTGKCILVDDCISAKKDLLNNVKPTACAITTDSVQVCCRDGTSAENTTLPNPDKPFQMFIPNLIYRYYASHLDVLRVSEKKCFDFLTELRIEARKIMDSTKDERILGGIAPCAGMGFIIGGTPAYPNEYPHMAAIGWETEDGDYKFNCGGSLISYNFVLSAAHCTYDPKAKNPEPAVVHLGDHNIDPLYKDGVEPMDVHIKTIHKHPDYHSPKKYNDIALLELVKHLTFNINIRPACLWARDDLFQFTHNKAVATGWGITDTGKPAKILQKVSLSLLDNEPCDWLLASIRNRNWWGFAPSQLCAGELAGGKDTCQGDSGGPLQVTGERCMYHVVGVTSHGHKCGQANKPAVYSRVTSYLSWIESIVWPGES